MEREGQSVEAAELPQRLFGFARPEGYSFVAILDFTGGMGYNKTADNFRKRRNISPAWRPIG